MQTGTGFGIRTTFGVLVVAAAVAVVTAIPVGAAPNADTTTTFTVAAGDLGITAPAATDLGAGAPGAPITSQLGSVVVSDQRALLAPTWEATVASGDFTTGGATAGETIGNELVDYWSGPATATTGEGMTFVPGQATGAAKVSLAASRPAFSLTAGVGNNSATWNPTLIVNTPPGAVGGVYSGTVTHSVA